VGLAGREQPLAPRMPGGDQQRLAIAGALNPHKSALCR
jgi:ABC-type polar amino acid transport system ATPase subunit